MIAISENAARRGNIAALQCFLLVSDKILTDLSVAHMGTVGVLLMILAREMLDRPKVIISGRDVLRH